MPYIFKLTIGTSGGAVAGTVMGVLLFLAVVNPRRACAARVTVLGLSVCLSVRPSVRPYVTR